MLIIIEMSIQKCQKLKMIKQCYRQNVLRDKAFKTAIDLIYDYQRGLDLMAYLIKYLLVLVLLKMNLYQVSISQLMNCKNHFKFGKSKVY